MTNQQGKVIAMWKLVSNLYKLGATTKANPSVISSLTITHDNTANVLHKRLGHINKKRLHQIQFMSTSIETFYDKEICLCTSCIQSKQHKKKFPKEGVRWITKLLGIVHFDICGLLQIGTHLGCIYFITFINEFSIYIYIYI